MAAMEAASPLCRIPFLWTVGSRPSKINSTASLISLGRRRSHGLIIINQRLRTPSTLGELAETVAETGKSEITWPIIVGTIAGIIPFIVAVEFS